MIKTMTYYEEIKRGFETGARLRGFAHKNRKLPKSLYTQLPRRFCMEKTNDLPGILTKSRERRVTKVFADRQPDFWHLPDDLTPVKASFDHRTTVH